MYDYHIENLSIKYYRDILIGATVHTRTMDYYSEGWVTPGRPS